MNTAQIKAYAPKARRDFIQAVTEKANQVGLSAENIEPVEIKGDVAIIAGRPFPEKIGELQKKLAERIQKDGFDQVMEAVALHGSTGSLPCGTWRYTTTWAMVSVF